MDYKAQIKTQLALLKDYGLSRRDVEKELGYSENYLDQIITKGGNEKVLNSLIILAGKCEVRSITLNEDKTPYLTAKEQIEMMKDMIEKQKAQIVQLKELIEEQEIMIRNYRGKAGGRRNSA